MNRFSEERAIVTGATGLVGSAIADRLAREGASVVVPSRQETKAKRWISGQENPDPFRPAVLDLSERATIEQCLDELQNKDALPEILVAGASNRSALGPPFEELDHEDFLELERVDIAGHVILARELHARRDGCRPTRIVFISSIYGNRGVDPRIYPEQMAPTPIHYAASKGAIQSACRWLAARLGSDARVNAIVAGGVRSEERQPDAFIREYKRRTMLDRMATPEEIAAATAFLASSDASYITGATIPVDGGFTAL